MSSTPSLTLKRRLKAPPSKIYQAWTRPEHMIQWWGINDDVASRVAEVDVRVGGRFRVEFEIGNGKRDSVSGVYREVVPDRRLVFSWTWGATPERESQVTIDLRPDGDSTILTLTHEQLFDQKSCDDHIAGWNIILDNLAKQFP
jgi:uncharacterized protein YndB with AHSA1/START domain